MRKICECQFFFLPLRCQTKNERQMTVLEQRFMERMPILLHELVKELEEVNKKLDAIEKKLDNKTTEE